MSLASPERLMWLWIAVPIIVLYILKTRLRRQPVATLLFWDQIFEEKRQRSLWQNLRRWLSLLLQLIFVSLLAFALADPLWRWQADSGQEVILVVDNSASMQAVEPETGQTRLQLAVDRAASLARGLRQGDQMALVTAGTTVRVVVGMSDFAPAIEEAIHSIQPTDGPTQIKDAIEAARRLADEEERRRIVVITDTTLDEQNDIESAEDLSWESVGTSQTNLAITTFQVRRSSVDPIGYALLVEVRNFSDEPSSTRLKLTLGDDLVDVVPIKLEADGVWQTTIEGTSREGGVLTASLDATDGLSVDNTARAVVPARPFVPVTLITGPDDQSFYLRTVLESIPLIKLRVVNDTEQTAKNGLTIYSGTVPNKLPPGPALFIARDDGPPGTWKLGNEIDTPIVAKQDKESPLLRHVQLQNVMLAGGRDIEVDESLGEAITLLETADTSRVLVSVEREAGRILILSANLDDSDLPLRIAFPVMMTNAMNWFFRQTGDMNPALNTGLATTVPWDFDAASAVLMSPDGNVRNISVARDRAAISPIGKAGVYGLFSPESLPKPDMAPQSEQLPIKTPEEWKLAEEVPGELLAVNLCSAEESDLRVAQQSNETTSLVSRGGAPAWFYLVMLAIALVIGEWALFHRRVVA